MRRLYFVLPPILACVIAVVANLPAQDSKRTKLAAFDASALTSLNASQLTTGTIPDARFPATLPAVSGANLTGIQSVYSATSSSLANGSTLTVTHASDANYYRDVRVISDMPGDSTVFYASANGTDASQAFTDTSFYSRTITANGNAQVDTGQSKFGGSSLQLDGNGDFLSFSGTITDFAFPGDFTVMCWIRTSVIGGDYGIIDFRPASTNGSYLCLYLQAGGAIRVYVNNTDVIVSSGISTNTWYHICLARSGTQTKLFLNGTQSGSTYTDSNSYGQGSNRPYIGAFGTTGASYFSGWIDDVVIVKGAALYTSNFTAPTTAYSPAAAIQGLVTLASTGTGVAVRWGDSSGANLATKTLLTNNTGTTLKNAKAFVCLLNTQAP